MTGGLVGPEYDKQIRDAIRKIRAMPVYTDSRGGTQRVEPAAARLLIYNDSGEEIPPWGCIEVANVDTGINRIGLVGVKPTGSDGVFVFNGVRAIPADGVGPFQIGTIVRCLFADGTGANGDGYAPFSGSWKLEVSAEGEARALGAVPGEADQMFAELRHTKSDILVKAPVGGIPGRVGTLLGSASCSVYEISGGMIADSGDSVTVYNWASSAVCDNGDRYGVAAMINGVWVIISEDCGDEGATVLAAGGTGSSGSHGDAIDTGTASPAVGAGVSGTHTFTSGLIA